jgi:hypothetical protein
LQPIWERFENKGIEISLTTLNIKNPNFEWTTMVAFSYNKNTINALYGNMEDVKDGNGNVIGTKEADDKTNGWFIGKPISQIWDYKVTEFGKKRSGRKLQNTDSVPEIQK